MKFDKFLDRWYNIKKENVFIRRKENSGYIELGVDTLPGNLKKIVNQCRYYYDSVKSDWNVSNYIYSYNKDVFFTHSFFFYDFVSEIANRIQHEMPHILVGTISEEDKLSNVNSILEDREIKTNNKLKHELVEFCSNGSFKIELFSTTTISDADAFYMDDIYKDAFLNFLNRVENITLENAPIYSLHFVTLDKKYSEVDFSISLEFYNKHYKIEIDNNKGHDLKELNDINKLVKNSIYPKSLEKFSGQLEYKQGENLLKIKELFVRYIINNINIPLFDINTGNDFQIKETNNRSYFLKSKGKIILNNGSISINTFKTILNELVENQEFSQLLLRSIKE